MKFFLLFIFISTPLFAQECTEGTLASATYPLLNCDSLEISSSVDLRSISTPIIINVNGDVTIKAQIKLSGTNGGLLTSDDNGGKGGPGASAGGGSDFLDSASGLDAPHGGERGFRDVNVNCGDGAAGGGLVTIGTDGFPCLNSTNPPSLGGEAADLTNIETAFRGGHGGGAGALVSLPIASGGGGGGAIYINATGNIKLTSKASIIANGGNGANSTNSNGAGGAGSGGVIILEAQNITIQGKLSALGGKGGKSPTGGHGGNGSNGLIRIKDSKGVQDYFGVKSGKVPSELKLDSNISCGTIAMGENEREKNHGPFLFLQILFPLLAMIAISSLRKKVLLQASK